MNPMLKRRAAVAVLVGASLTLTGCAQYWKRLAHQPHATVPVAKPGPRIAQVAFGGQARFALCTAALCPAVTRKTLARETVPERAPERAAEPAQTEAVQVRLAPVAASGDGQAPVAGAGKPHYIYFDRNSATLSETAVARLDTLLPAAQRAGAILIVGHTDSRGSATANAKVAAARARAVQSHFGARDPALREKLRVVAQGACCYVAPNGTVAGRAANRRVAVHLTRNETPAVDREQ